MQAFVHRNQRKLDELLEDAAEWASAPEAAALERKSDWELVSEAAASQCCHGDQCPYDRAVKAVVERNAGSFSLQALAVALRATICGGPSKTCRVPLLVGATNTGKTTLVESFEQLFGHKHVFHKPVLGSSFALRNITKSKRFLLWDDFRPVEYAQKTVPVTTFLSLFSGHSFEVQASQSFSDGNPDVVWRHGAVLTAKEKGLWQAAGEVSEEDVRHMQSRVLIFPLRAGVGKLQKTDPCAVHLAWWLVGEAASADAAEALHGPLAALAAVPAASGSEAVVGLKDLLQSALLSPSAPEAIDAELASLGAVHVQELAEADWRDLAAVSALEAFGAATPL